MTDSKEEKTMPLELAIQRELAYRRKVAALSLQPTETSTEKLLPLQVIQPCQAPRPLPLPSPTSNPIPTPCISGTKRKEPLNRAYHHLPLKKPEPFHGSFTSKARIELTDNLYCKVCQLSCSSPVNLRQHLRGRKHKARVQELKFSQKTGIEGKSNQRQWCELCKVPCMNEDLLRMHFQGQKHKAELQKLEVIKNGGETPNRKKWCELCRIWCSDESAFKQHLQGKKHICKLHATQKE